MDQTSVRNLAEAGRTIPGPWLPRVAGDVNDYQVKVARFENEFDWHSHDNEDEAFLVVEGRIAIDFRDGTCELGQNDFLVVPRTVEHRPRAVGGPAVVVMFEPNSTVNTGSAVTDRTLAQLEKLD